MVISRMQQLMNNHDKGSILKYQVQLRTEMSRDTVWSSQEYETADKEQREQCSTVQEQMSWKSTTQT